MSDAASPAPSERGWGKLLLALAAFLFLPHLPPLNSLLPVEETLLLLLPCRDRHLERVHTNCIPIEPMAPKST